MLTKIKESRAKSAERNVWVANFYLLTSCETVCPPMSGSYAAKLQKMAKDEGLDVRFVSFSVDPEVDTPLKMKDYATKFGADFSNWDFLTGYKQAEIEKVCAGPI